MPSCCDASGHSLPALGAGSRWFKSNRPDQFAVDQPSNSDLPRCVADPPSSWFTPPSCAISHLLCLPSLLAAARMDAGDVKKILADFPGYGMPKRTAELLAWLK